MLRFKQRYKYYKSYFGLKENEVFYFKKNKETNRLHVLRRKTENNLKKDFKLIFLSYLN